MRRFWLSGSFLLTVVLCVGILQPRFAEAQKLPPSVTMGSNPPGTLFYALASGLSKVASSAGPIQVTVQPYSGTSTFIPLINGGEVDLGVVNAVDMGMAYQGPDRLKIGGRNPFVHTPNVRLVMRGAPLQGAPVARKDSGIKTIRDLKGKRVTGEYPAHLAVWYNMFGSLANGGMTWNDVTVVPVPAVNEGVDALVQGRADVATHAIGSAKIKEADAAVGVRYVTLDCSAEGRERIMKAVPGYYLRTIKGGATTGILDDTCVFAYDIYLLTHKAAPNHVVAAILKSIWDNVDKLPALHPVFKQWTRERAVGDEVTIPYHPGAVEFYKAQGQWSAKAGETQKRLLSLNP